MTPKPPTIRPARAARQNWPQAKPLPQEKARRQVTPPSAVLTTPKPSPAYIVPGFRGSIASTLNGVSTGGLTLVHTGAGARAFVVRNTLAMPLLVAASSVDTAQVGTQYWIVGVGRMNGRVLEIADVVSATGTRFGDAFRPSEVVRKRWGSVRIEFTGCRAGQFSWNATGDNSAGFGSGQYAVSPLVPTAFTTQCEAVPFAQVQGTDWINGSWWGGAPRDGEGFFLTQAPDGTVFFAWFTYRPPS